MKIVIASAAVVITIVIAWVILSICAVAKRSDEDEEFTGTESPLTDAQVRQILMRKREGI